MSTFAEGDETEKAAHVREMGSRAKKGVLWLGSTTTLWQVLSWGFTLLTARLLEPNDYGVVAFAETVVPYLIMVSTLNVSNWMVQTKTFEKRDQESVFSLTLVMGTLMCVFNYLLAPHLANFFEDPRTELPIKLFGLIAIFKGIYSLPEALLRRELHFKPLALMNFSIGMSRAVLQVVLAYLGYGYWALVVGILYKEVITTAWLIVVRGIPRKFRLDFELYRNSFGYGVPATIADFFWIIFTTADNVVVGKLCGSTLLGYYSMAFHLTDLPMSKVNIIIRPVLFPYFSRLKAYPQELRANFLRIVEGAGMLICPMLIGLSVVAPLAVPVILGENWEQMIRPLQLMCFVGLLRFFVDQIGPLVLALGHPKKLLKYHAVIVAVMPAAFVVFGLWEGLAGVFVAWIFVFPVVAFTALLALRDLTQIGPLDYLGSLKVPLLASIAMAICVYAVRGPVSGNLSMPIALVAEIALGVLIYAATLWLFFRPKVSSIAETLRSK